MKISRKGNTKHKLEITYRDENDENNTYSTKTLDLLIPIKPAPYLIVESITTTSRETCSRAPKLNSG